MRGNLPWVAAALVVVAIVGVLGWALYPAAPAPAPALEWRIVAVLEGGIPWEAFTGGFGGENSPGFENLYIMRHDSGYDKNTDLSTYKNNATYWMTTWNPSEGWVENVEYGTRFDMVWATRVETPQMARVCRENLKVEYNLIGDFVYLENSTDAMEVVFENQNYYGTNGFLRVNAIFDNSANGWIMRAGESWNFNVGLWLWT